MNSSKTNQILKSVENELQLQSTDLTSLVTNLGQVNLQTGTNGVTLSSIDSSTTSNNGLLTNIESDVSDLNRKKILFNARLTDGTNNYLAKADYSSSPIDFYWQNDKNTPVYIYEYRFIYPESTEPTASQLYHSTAWSCNIGCLNSDESAYEAPYITIEDNKDNLHDNNPNAPKQQWVSNTSWVFDYHFDTAPIEVGVSRKFGHNIAADIDTSLYDDNPVGIIEGYYYSS